MRSTSRRWVLLLLLPVAALGLHHGGRLGSTTVRAAPGLLYERIIARAVVQPVDGVAKVRAQVDGRLRSVRVREGDRVEAGQVLCEIEAGDVESELLRREAELRATSASADTVAEGIRPEERTALEAEERAARHEFELAQDRANRQRDLLGRGGTTRAAAEEAIHAAASARARLDQVEARLRQARSGGRPADVEAARARVAAAEAEVKAAQQELSWTRVLAPIPGVVLARHVDPGDTITGTRGGMAPLLFEIADVSRIHIRAEIEEFDADRPAIGLQAELTRPGGGQALGHGRIVRLSDRLERRTIGADDARVRADGWVRAAWIEIDAENGRMPRWPVGERLEARIELMPQPAAVLVPRAAIEVRDGQAWVRVPRLLWPRQVPVEIRAGDAQNVELRGLAAGASVLVPRP